MKIPPYIDQFAVIKNLSTKILHTLLALAILSSCAPKKPARIIMKGKDKYTRSNAGNKNQHHISETKNRKNTGPIIVGKGDTIYSISTKNKVPLRDLISENNLKPPYILKLGRKIILPDTKYHQVVAGDTLYSISRNYDMNVDDLIKINNLEKPYNIRLGDQLRITDYSSLATKNQALKNANHPRIENENKITANKKLQPDEQLETKNNKFIWPIKGKIISKFGFKAGGLYNDGINIKANNGDPVKAVEDGTIAYVGNELRGYGNLIIMKHSGSWISAYAHLEKFEVKRGDKVTKGTPIAKVGSTGNVDSPQLYFGIRKGKEAVNPELYLKNEALPSKADKASKITKIKLKSK